MTKKLYKLDKVVFLSHYFTTEADFTHFAQDLIHTLAKKRSVDSCLIISVQDILDKTTRIPGYLVDVKDKWVSSKQIELVNKNYDYERRS